MNEIHFVEEGHKYFTDKEMTNQVPCISDILEYFGYTDYEKLRRMGQGAAIDAAALYGSAVHATTKHYDLGTLESYDPQIEEELQGWRDFREDNDIDEFDLIETPLYSKVWSFAGTPDRWFGKDIPEIKTCNPQLAHELQTGFQQILIEENFKVKIRKRYCVQLTKKHYKIHPHKNKSDINVAKCMLTVYNDKKSKGIL